MRIIYKDKQVTNYNIDMKWVLDCKDVLAMKISMSKDLVNFPYPETRRSWRKAMKNFSYLALSLILRARSTSWSVKSHSSLIPMKYKKSAWV